MSSTLRGVLRAVNQMERAAARQRRRNSIQRYKQLERQRIAANAAAAIQDYEHYIDSLISVHKDANQIVDWNSLLASPEPSIPQNLSTHEDAAVAATNNYRPSFLVKLVKLESWQRKNLQKKVAQARKKDEQDFKEWQNKYSTDHTEWQETQTMAKGVLNKEIQIYKQALEFFGPFADIAELGTKMNFTLFPDYVRVDLYVHGRDIIPHEIPTQTSTGKPSKKKMPAGRYNELYREHISSCLLRVAREMFACLPIHLVVINGVADLLNTSTGFRSEQAIYSVAFTANRMEGLNFDDLNPADAMKNFTHRVNFGKTTGFSPVDKLDPEHLMVD